jgi:hypothetical protein
MTKHGYKKNTCIGCRIMGRHTGCHIDHTLFVDMQYNGLILLGPLRNFGPIHRVYSYLQHALKSAASMRYGL